MTQDSIKRGVAKVSRTDQTPSIISAGLKITGKVVSDGVVHIEGEVDGDIQCTDLTIGADGTVNGYVTAADVLVLGRMAGTIRGKRVRLAHSATVTGEVIHEQLTVEPGARLDGYYRPVEKLTMSAEVDIRRQIGRTPHGGSLLPRRALPPFRKRRRGAASLQKPPETTSKPLH